MTSYVSFSLAYSLYPASRLLKDLHIQPNRASSWNKMTVNTRHLLWFLMLKKAALWHSLYCLSMREVRFCPSEHHQNDTSWLLGTSQLSLKLSSPGQEQVKLDQTNPGQARPDQADENAAASPSHAQESHHAQTAAPSLHYAAPSGLDVTSLPDGIATWREQRGLQILWLLSSIFMVMLDIVGLDVGFLAGLLGIIGSSLAVCNCFQGMDLRSIVKVCIHSRMYPKASASMVFTFRLPCRLFVFWAI